MRKVAIGNNEFTFDLYQKLKSTPGNIFYSPYGIFCALAMAYAGAGGDTAREMAAVLHFDPADVSQHNALYVLQREIERCNSEITRIHIANAMWAQKGWDFRPWFLKLVEENYGGALKMVDFVQDPEASCREINQWVSERTNNHINEMLQPGGLSDLTTMIITNAIYFKARWPRPFDISCTQNDSFYAVNGEEILVPMMKEGSCDRYAKGDNYQAIDLPYADFDLNMIIIMPDEGQFSSFENCLDYCLLDSILQDLKHFDWRKMPGNYTEISLSMPKFKFKSNFQMSKYLRALGMKNALEREADFSGMSNAPILFIDELIHDTFVSVDEYGTEAVAATLGMYFGATQIPKILDFVINRPFIFLIKDFFSGTILFIGRVLNPLE